MIKDQAKEEIDWHQYNYFISFKTYDYERYSDHDITFRVSPLYTRKIFWICDKIDTKINLTHFLYLYLRVYFKLKKFPLV